MSETAPGQAMVARHAIFDRHQRVVAYELNYHRDTQLDRMLATDPDASSEIILNTYTSISDQGEVKRVPAFIPLPLEMVLGASMPSLPAKQVVFQLQVPRTPGPEYPGSGHSTEPGGVPGGSGNSRPCAGVGPATQGGADRPSGCEPVERRTDP